MNELEMLLRIMLASVMSGVVGLERGIENKPAGLKTHMILGGSAALIIGLGKVLVNHFITLFPEAVIHTDPIRLIQGIIIGLSFLGAGTILKNEKEYKVKYLTTAASLFFSTGIGIAVGLQQYMLSIGLVFIILLINLFANKIEEGFQNMLNKIDKAGVETPAKDK